MTDPVLVAVLVSIVVAAVALLIHRHLSNELHARLKTFAAQANGDTIVLTKVPAGYTFAFGMINASATFGGTATIAIGIAGTTGKYRTAATHTTTVPTLFGLYTAADDVPLAAEETILLTIAAADLPGSGSAVIDMYFSAP